MIKKIKEFLLHNPTRTIALSFVMVILIGTFLLCLPISNKASQTTLLNHFFVATSATCVTGLVPVCVAEQYTLFGQIVIIVMIQIGGLGFLTLLMLFFVLMKKRLSFSSRLLMSEAINKNSLNHITDYLRYIIKYTFIVESIGAIVLFFVFIQNYSFLEAIYYSIFHSVSAFCNAGFDVLGNSSLISYQDNPIVLVTIASLISLGGIGFLVAEEIQQKVKNYKNSHDSFKKWILSFSLHTKIVLVMSLSLIVIGTILVYIFEKDNPQTMAHLSPVHQLINSFFQSVTYRTAGFAAINQAGMLEISKLIGCVLMFIGGSPAGTAGGIKTMTAAVLYLAVRSTLKGDRQVVAFSRRINEEMVFRAITVICISLVIVVSSTLLLCISETFSLVDILYETFSAYATVGLTSNVTPFLSSFGKIVIIILMYIGRIGPVTMMISLMKKSHQYGKNEIKYPDGDIIVG